MDEFRREMAQEQTNIQEATQKIIAGYNLMTMGDVDGAIDLFQRAVAIFPQAFNGYTSLGYAYDRKGDTFRAIECFQKAIQIFPDRKEPYNDIARLYARNEAYELALDYVEKAASIDPSVLSDVESDPLFDPIRTRSELRERYEKIRLTHQ